MKGEPQKEIKSHKNIYHDDGAKLLNNFCTYIVPKRSRWSLFTYSQHLFAAHTIQ